MKVQISNNGYSDFAKGTVTVVITELPGDNLGGLTQGIGALFENHATDDPVVDAEVLELPDLCRIAISAINDVRQLLGDEPDAWQLYEATHTLDRIATEPTTTEAKEA